MRPRGRIATIVRQHHERYDGNGYPDRRADEDITLEARILAVCDSWSAMRADRCYQAAMPAEMARVELIDGRGGQFDPDVVDAFLELEHAGVVGTMHLRAEHRDTTGLVPAPDPVAVTALRA